MRVRSEACSFDGWLVLIYSKKKVSQTKRANILCDGCISVWTSKRVCACGLSGCMRAMLMYPIKKLEENLFVWADPVGQVSTWVAPCLAQHNFGVVHNFTFFC
jgi:hypothetical protein